MSMRDFITRVLNTPVVVVTTPRIVVETTPAYRGRRHPRSWSKTLRSATKCEGSSEKPFYWDIESRSAAVLGSGKLGVGARAYAEHPTTEILCVSYARGNGPIETWVPGQPIPEEVSAAAADPRCPWVAHNAAFERAMLECILVPLHGWPMVPVDRHVCTMSLALAHAYPGSLEGVAEILGLVNQKDTAREKIIRVMWKPRKPRRGGGPNQDLLGRFAGTASRAVYLQQARRRRRTRAASTPKAAGAAGVGARYVGARRRDQRSRRAISTPRWPRRRLRSRRKRSPTLMSACGTRPMARWTRHPRQNS